MAEDQNTWEQNTIKKVLEMTVKEQRAARRWSVFFKLAFLGYILLMTVIFFAGRKDVAVTVGKSYTAVVSLNDMIAPGADASADNLIPLIRKAFSSINSKGVILKINSPGGSPVQSNLIYQEILKQRAKHPDKKVYAVIEDLGASGAYWVACACDQIYADQSSIVGSIGAAISSFGFVDALQKLGVQRRLYTSGSNKGMLDPFLPQTKEQLAIIDQEIKIMLNLFTEVVKTGRGERPKITPDMFSGRIWLGVEAVDLGLIDGIGNTSSVAADVIGAPDLVDYSPKRSFLSQLGKQMGAAMSSAFTSAVSTAMITDL